jgi:hypothetical protein
MSYIVDRASDDSTSLQALEVEFSEPRRLSRLQHTIRSHPALEWHRGMKFDARYEHTAIKHAHSACFRFPALNARKPSYGIKVDPPTFTNSISPRFISS